MDHKMLDNANAMVQGHVKIWDPLTQEVFIDKPNAIHYENMSEALATAVANKGTQYIQNMVFGNGATVVDSTGVITYLPPNTYGQNAILYNETFSKIVDDTSALNLDPTRNFIEIRHTPGLIYTDIFVSCLLDYAEPTGQQAFDNSPTMTGTYVFDELGLESADGKLLTHVIFHPVQKALNRLIQIDYTVRIQTLTNLSSNL
jgi:hypothetical protein